MRQVDLDAGSEIRMGGVVSIIQTGTLVSLIAKLSCYKNQVFCYKTSTGIFDRIDFLCKLRSVVLDL